MYMKTTILEKFLNTNFDQVILSLPSQNHTRRDYVAKHITSMMLPLIKFCIEELGYSSNYIAKNIFSPKGYVIGAGEIIDFCKKNNILTKTIKEQANSKFVRNQYEQTCLFKYGATNALSKGTKIFKKRNKTVKKKYGVDNVWKLPSVKKKIKNTMYEKYGVRSAIHLPSYEPNFGRRSKLHIKIESLLSEKNIQFESEVKNKFCAFNDFLQREYSPIVDILIEDKKIVIEVNGDMWHANPKKYKPTDLIHKWGGRISAEKIWQFDKARKQQIEKFGYIVITIWEDDVKKNNKKLITLLNEKVFKNNWNQKN